MCCPGIPQTSSGRRTAICVPTRGRGFLLGGSTAAWRGVACCRARGRDVACSIQFRVNSLHASLRVAPLSLAWQGSQHGEETVQQHSRREWKPSPTLLQYYLKERLASLLFVRPHGVVLIFTGTTTLSGRKWKKGMSRGVTCSPSPCNHR